MVSSRVALEVDGDQVTFVEMSGDLAVSSVTVNASTLRDSVQTVMKGFRQKRSDPPIPVSLVAPGFRFDRIDVSSEDVEDPLRLAERLDPSGTLSLALTLPDTVDEGAVASAFVTAVPAELVDAVAQAMGPIRHEVFLAAACMPVDGVFVGLHMSAASLTVISDGRPVSIRELEAGGLSRVAAIVSPGDTQSGLAMVSEALGGAGSVAVSAEVARYFRGVFREVARHLRDLEGSGRLPEGSVEVCMFGVGAQDVLTRDAAVEAALQLASPRQVSDALLYLPVDRRLPALSALGAAVSAPSPLTAAKDGEESESPAGVLRAKARSAAAVLSLVAAVSAVSVAVFGLQQAESRLAAVESELAAFPATVLSDSAIQGSLASPPAPEWMVSVSSLYRSVPAGVRVVGVRSAEEGDVTIVLEDSGNLSGLYRTLELVRGFPGVVAAEVKGMTGDGESTFVKISVEVVR